MRLILAIAATAVALYMAAITEPHAAAPRAGRWRASFAGDTVALALDPAAGRSMRLVLRRGRLTALSIEPALDGAARIRFSLLPRRQGGRGARLPASARGGLGFEGVMRGDSASGRYAPLRAQPLPTGTPAGSGPGT